MSEDINIIDLAARNLVAIEILADCEDRCGEMCENSSENLSIIFYKIFAFVVRCTCLPSYTGLFIEKTVLRGRGNSLIVLVTNNVKFCPERL
jgi:hypothetical protein